MPENVNKKENPTMTAALHRVLTDEDIKLLVSELDERIDRRFNNHEFCKFKPEELESLRSFSKWWGDNGDVVRNFIKFWDKTRMAWWMMAWSLIGAFLMYTAYLIFTHFELLVTKKPN
jgi:hypothetical protein